MVTHFHRLAYIPHFTSNKIVVSKSLSLLLDNNLGPQSIPYILLSQLFKAKQDPDNIINVTYELFHFRNI